MVGGKNTERKAHKVLQEKQGSQMYYGTILEVSDGTWLIPGKRTKCYKKNEAAKCITRQY